MVLAKKGNWKKLRRKGIKIAGFHSISNSCCFAWRASAYHIALLVHQLPKREYNHLFVHRRQKCFFQCIPHLLPNKMTLPSFATRKEDMHIYMWCKTCRQAWVTNNSVNDDFFFILQISQHTPERKKSFIGFFQSYTVLT